MIYAKTFYAEIQSMVAEFGKMPGSMINNPTTFLMKTKS